MLIGFNDNITYKDEIFHVQTENRGLENPVIRTFIYRKGAIMVSKKMSYSEVTGDEDAEETIRQLMKNQHKNMINALLEGRFDEWISAGGKK